MIEVINLTKRYGDKKAVDNISFKAEEEKFSASSVLTERENPPP